MANGDAQNSAEFKTGLFGFKLIGRDALITFLFITILAEAGLTFWEHSKRSDEHDQIVCMIKLNLFIYTLPKGEPLDWSKMPVDLYSCVPKFLYENARPVR
jgi:hypothetical protein